MSIPEKRDYPCPLCDSSSVVFYDSCRDLEYFMTSERTLRRCSVCSLVFIDPIPTRQELPSLYPANYHNFDRPKTALSNSLFERYYSQQCRTVEKTISPGGTLLEVGSGAGDLLERLRIRGLRSVAGVEISSEGCERARAKGLDIFHGTIEEYNATDRFDFILRSRENRGKQCLSNTRGASPRPAVHHLESPALS